MTAPDPARMALAAVLVAANLEAAHAAARAGIARLAVVTPRQLLPLKQAVYVLGVSDKTARRWCAADEADGIAVFTRNRWYIDVEAAAAKRRGSR